MKQIRKGSLNSKVRALGTVLRGFAKSNGGLTKKIVAAAFFLCFAVAVNAQDLGSGIDSAAGTIKGLFTNISNLVFMIGGVTGLVGAVQVYQKFQRDDPQAQKHLIQWGSAFVFLMLSATILKTVFGM